jgi:phosphatidylethanolamine-binding protein (PEBP) family uncharacterized protein
MKSLLRMGLVFVFVGWTPPLTQSQSIQITGAVSNDQTLQPIPGAVVRLSISGIADTTNSQGQFTLKGESVALLPHATPGRKLNAQESPFLPTRHWLNPTTFISGSAKSPFSILGQIGRRRFEKQDDSKVPMEDFSDIQSFTEQPLPQGVFKVTADFMDTLIISATGFATTQIRVTSPQASGLAISLTAVSGSFTLSSPSWTAVDNENCNQTSTSTCPLYPQVNTHFGTNVSPEMNWTQGPPGTQSYALVLYDMNNDFVHWALWNIPSHVLTLAATLPAGTLENGAIQGGFNAGGNAKYFGSGACGHVYEHRLYALDVASISPASPITAATAKTAIEALRAKSGILAESFVRLQSRDYCTLPE